MQYNCIHFPYDIIVYYNNVGNDLVVHLFRSQTAVPTPVGILVFIIIIFITGTVLVGTPLPEPYYVGSTFCAQFKIRWKSNRIVGFIVAD